MFSKPAILPLRKGYALELEGMMIRDKFILSQLLLFFDRYTTLAIDINKTDLSNNDEIRDAIKKLCDFRLHIISTTKLECSTKFNFYADFAFATQQLESNDEMISRISERLQNIVAKRLEEKMREASSTFKI